MSENEEQIPEYAQPSYKHTEEDIDSGSIFGELDSIHSFKEHSELVFPVHLELKKDSSWYRMEETGKFYRITKELYYIIGNTEVRQDRYRGDDIAELEVKEMYSLIFGNISRKDTIGSLHFYMTQMSNAAYRTMTDVEFQDKLSMISQDFAEFIDKSYPNLKTKQDDNNWTEREESGDNGTPF